MKELSQLHEGYLKKANTKKDLQDKIKEYGIKAIPALSLCKWFDLYLDIILVTKHIASYTIL